jgi:hypothetical protein
VASDICVGQIYRAPSGLVSLRYSVRRPEVLRY